MKEEWNYGVLPSFHFVNLISTIVYNVVVMIVINYVWYSIIFQKGGCTVASIDLRSELVYILDCNIRNIVVVIIVLC